MNKDWNDRFIKEKCYSIDNDRFKEKAFVYAPFPEANKHGFQDGNIRHLIQGDIYSRYLRMQNMNVLYPTGFNSVTPGSFQESKKMYKSLGDESTDVFYKQMSRLGIGISDNKCISMRHKEYTSLLQLAFIDLYERNYIKYKMTSAYFDKEANKIYDSMDIEESLPKTSIKCFVLDIQGLIPQIVADIEKLDLSLEHKDLLISSLKPKDVLSLNFMLSNGELLEVSMENPEYMGGISYIFLNPNYIDIRDYVSKDEYGSVERYMMKEEGLYVFSGLLAKNPLTGLDIPVFISYMYPKGVYLGLPDIDPEDKLMVLNEGFDNKPILADGLLINSDILDGYTPKDAKEKIISAFQDAEIGSLTKIYKHSEILLSSLEPFGILFPFLEEKGKLNSLKDYLPYSFSSQFRPILGDDVDVSGSPIQGTISPLFTEGLCSILSLIYDDIGSLDSIFKDESRKLYEAWLPIKVSYIPEERLIPDLLMPLIFYNIIKKEVSYALPDLFKKVVILSKPLDIHRKSIVRSNNNLMDMDKYILKFGCDSLRLLASKVKEMVYDTYELTDISEYINRIKQALLSAVNEKVISMDYYFHKLAYFLKSALDQANIEKYIEILKEFNEKVIFHEIISKEQALDYLRMIYPIFPYLSEELYEEEYNGKYSILNLGWPN